MVDVTLLEMRKQGLKASTGWTIEWLSQQGTSGSN